MKFRAIRNSWIRLEPFDPAKMVVNKIVFVCENNPQKRFLFNLHEKLFLVCLIGVVTTKAVATLVVWCVDTDDVVALVVWRQR